MTGIKNTKQSRQHVNAPQAYRLLAKLDLGRWINQYLVTQQLVCSESAELVTWTTFLPSVNKSRIKNPTDALLPTGPRTAGVPRRAMGVSE